MLTKVKLRQKPLADGKLSLYLDFYSPIADPVTGKKTRQPTRSHPLRIRDHPRHHRHRNALHQIRQQNTGRRCTKTGSGTTISGTLVRRRSMLSLCRLQPRKIHLRSPDGRHYIPDQESPLRQLRTLRQTIPAQIHRQRNRPTPHLPRQPLPRRNQPLCNRSRTLRRKHNQRHLS